MTADLPFDCVTVDDMIADIRKTLSTASAVTVPFTLLVGAGFSVPVIPTARGMAESMPSWLYTRTKSGSVSEDSARAFWADVALRAHRDGKDLALTPGGQPDLTTSENTGRAYQYAMVHGLGSPARRRAYLRHVVGDAGRRINPAHLFLANILSAQDGKSWRWPVPFARTVFTTNFDPLLQLGLQLVNKLYFMTDRPETLRPPSDSEHDAIHLVYTHGSVHQYRLANTDSEIRRFAEIQAERLPDYFQRHGVIVVGYSGWMDACMRALAVCEQFEHNLYWCDVHPPGEAARRLRLDVVELLAKHRDNAFYVHIDGGADALMHALHAGLALDHAPRFVLDPLAPLLEQLGSINISAPGRSGPREPTTLADVLERTLARLEAAKRAFNDPSGVNAGEALVAKLMNDAMAAALSGQPDVAIGLWSTVIDSPAAPAKDRAAALSQRGITWGDRRETAKEIADYNAILGMRDASPHQKAWALYNRGLAWGEERQTDEEIADYTAVVVMAEASAQQRALALFNRALAWAQKGITDKEIADYATIIEMPDAPPDPKASAFNNRGATWSTLGRLDEAIADYTTAIGMAGATASDTAIALNNRGLAWTEKGETGKAVADFAAVLQMPDAPSEEKAAALESLGPSWSARSSAAAAIPAIGALGSATAAARGKARGAAIPPPAPIDAGIPRAGPGTRTKGHAHTRAGSRARGGPK